uniref:Uncharacterized protein n=1 Tax=candidate division WOR-3 bacterium TaxID=2052148 RepID=A0A7C4X9C8_UNCW3
MFIIFLLLTNSDMLFSDTINVDTIDVYKVPEVIQFGGIDSPADSLYTILKIIPPDISNPASAEILLGTPFFVQKKIDNYLVYTPFNTSIRVNGRRMDNDFFGQFNLLQLPVQFFEEIDIKNFNDGSSERSIDFLSKVIKYNRPFSSIYFTLLGEDKIYNIDFTRNLSKSIFFYSSGLYSNFYNPLDTLYLKNSSFYTDLYYNQFLPVRLDVFYSNNNYGKLLDYDFLDGCLTLGSAHHKIALFHTLINNNFARASRDTMIYNTIKISGFKEESKINWKGFNFDSGLDGFLESIDSDLYGIQRVFPLSIYENLKRDFSHFVFGFSSGQKVEILEERKFIISILAYTGYRIHNSVFFYLRIGKSHKNPKIYEKMGIPALFFDNYILNPNPNLTPEDLFTRELGIKGKDFFINFYKIDINDYMYFQWDSLNYYTVRNLNSFSNSGCEVFFRTKFFASFFIESSANYFFKDDSFQTMPRGHFCFAPVWQRKTPRSVLNIGVRLWYVGKRNDPFAERKNPFWTVSGYFGVKFLSLSLTLILDNLLNENFPEYSLFYRKLNLAIKWEFLD